MHFRSALHSAAASGHAAVVRTLVDAGADLSSTDGSGSTPISTAARHEHLGVVAILTAAEQVRQREFFIDNLLVRIHFIIVMIRRTGLAPWSLNSLFQVALHLPSQLSPNLIRSDPGPLGGWASRRTSTSWASRPAQGTPTHRLDRRTSLAARNIPGTSGTTRPDSLMQIVCTSIIGDVVAQEVHLYIIQFRSFKKSLCSPLCGPSCVRRPSPDVNLIPAFRITPLSATPLSDSYSLGVKYGNHQPPVRVIDPAPRILVVAATKWLPSGWVVSLDSQL